MDLLQEFLSIAKVSTQDNGLYKVTFPIIDNMVCYVVDCKYDTEDKIKEEAYHYIQQCIFDYNDSSRAFIKDK